MNVAEVFASMKWQRFSKNFHRLRNVLHHIMHRNVYVFRENSKIQKLLQKFFKENRKNRSQILFCTKICEIFNFSILDICTIYKYFSEFLSLCVQFLFFTWIFFICSFAWTIFFGVLFSSIHIFNCAHLLLGMFYRFLMNANSLSSVF